MDQVLLVVGQQLGPDPIELCIHAPTAPLLRRSARFACTIRTEPDNTDRSVLLGDGPRLLAEAFGVERGEMRLNKVQGRRARLRYRPWGFDLGAIRCPHVHVWHGPLDRNVSIETGRAIADAVSGSRSHFRPTDADLSVAINYGEEILEALLVER